MKKNIIATLTAGVLAVFAPVAAVAHGGENHDHDHEHMHEGSGNVSIPETLEELWKAIQEAHGKLAEAVSEKSDEKSHEPEEALQAYLKALPEKIADFEETRRKRIEGQAKNLARAYDAIHHAAHDGQWEKASSEITKADGVLKLLSALLEY